MSKTSNIEYPKFSVLMSLYIKEKAEYFDECMKSMIAQTVRPTEIVIVFDGPISDELKRCVDKYVEEYPGWIKIVVNKKNKGLGLGGCFECALDGCFGSHDAAVKQSYVDETGGNGVLYYDDQKVIEFCKKANREGLQIELHAIGDKAFDQATMAIKAALDDYPRKNHRHGIIHDCLPTEEGIEICRKYNILMPVQSAFINWRQEPDEYLKSILGKERLEMLNPIKTFYDNNLVVSFGSDAPCTDPDPISWMDRAVNNSNSKQAVTIQDALRMCTYNGYYTGFDEKERGSLEVGKVADMVILSENPYEIPKSRISTLKVERLILSGKPYESCQKNIVTTIVNGIMSHRKA